MSAPVSPEPVPVCDPVPVLTQTTDPVPVPVCDPVPVPVAERVLVEDPVPVSVEKFALVPVRVSVLPQFRP